MATANPTKDPPKAAGVLGVSVCTVSVHKTHRDRANRR